MIGKSIVQRIEKLIQEKEMGIGCGYGEQAQTISTDELRELLIAEQDSQGLENMAHPEERVPAWVLDQFSFLHAKYIAALKEIHDCIKHSEKTRAEFLYEQEHIKEIEDRLNELKERVILHVRSVGHKERKA